MATDAEVVLEALRASLAASAPAGVEFVRNAALRQRIPAAGLAILRDGDPGEPDYTLSPLTWHWEHRAVLDLIVDGAEGGQRDARFDALRAWVGGTLAADRTLGGAVEWVEAEPPAVEDIQSEDGSAAVKAGTVGVVLHYSTSGEMS